VFTFSGDFSHVVFGLVVAHWSQSTKLLCIMPINTGMGDLLRVGKPSPSTSPRSVVSKHELVVGYKNGDQCDPMAHVAWKVLRIFGSRPSDHYFRSVCLSVCLFVQFFSAVFDPISIKLGHMLYVWV